jgi:hypothetical protein
MSKPTGPYSECGKSISLGSPCSGFARQQQTIARLEAELQRPKPRRRASCTCETKYGVTGGCVICNPRLLLDLADRAQAVCDAQLGSGDRCCLMKEVAVALRAVAGVMR